MSYLEFTVLIYLIISYKVRCAQGNKGKSGGIRVIYYWVNEDHQIFFLLAYPKSVKDTLTDKETAILRQLVKEQLHG